MAEKNRYQGVNAHLMSYLQNEDSYTGFHNLFIAILATTLNRQLYGQYRAKTEGSLRILKTLGNGQPLLKIVRPDVMLREKSTPTSQNLAASTVQPTQLLDMPELEDTDKPLSVVIYESHKPVTVIEVVSPNNKIGTEKRGDYQEKRYLITRLGISLIEIDFLHETRSVIEGLAAYPNDPTSTPYYIAITDPAHNDKTAIYKFGINELIPTLNIPLLGDDVIACDFDKVYQQTFEDGVFDDDVNYAVVPARFSSYSPPDQHKIRDVMGKIL